MKIETSKMKEKNKTHNGTNPFDFVLLIEAALIAPSIIEKRKRYCVTTRML
jgi:hypothetical protein